MRAVAAIFGAPVTDPHGNKAVRTATRSVLAGTSASTVEVSCQTVS